VLSRLRGLDGLFVNLECETMRERSAALGPEPDFGREGAELALALWGGSSEQGAL